MGPCFQCEQIFTNGRASNVCQLLGNCSGCVDEHFTNYTGRVISLYPTSTLARPTFVVVGGVLTVCAATQSARHTCQAIKDYAKGFYSLVSGDPKSSLKNLASGNVHLLKAAAYGVASVILGGFSAQAVSCNNTK